MYRVSSPNIFDHPMPQAPIHACFCMVLCYNMTNSSGNISLVYVYNVGMRKRN
jgi:hypothetical protein